MLTEPDKLNAILKLAFSASTSKGSVKAIEYAIFLALFLLVAVVSSVLSNLTFLVPPVCVLFISSAC